MSLILPHMWHLYGDTGVGPGDIALEMDYGAVSGEDISYHWFGVYAS